MAIRLQHSTTYSTYFVTFTCIQWLPLITITNSYDLFYNWFSVLKEKYRANIVAYVIMPNHIHVILHFHDANFELNKIVSNGKRFIAYEIINRLTAAGNTELLRTLGNIVSENEKKKGQLHKVFKGSFDAKAVITHPFLLQKINYIHNNPVSGKWNLAKDIIAYEHSSASFYETGLMRHFRCLHYADL